jgi:prepilin-type N-terminal cleavage/methylation domain-containing protein
MKTAQKGFTLIELAVALTVVAFIIGGLAVPISTRLAEQQYADTQANIDKAVEALVGYAVLTGRLPCPDVNTIGAADNRDGTEKPAGGPCASGVAGGAIDYSNSTGAGVSWGDLPWQTLGLQAPYNQDAWNNRLRYAVVTTLAGAVADSPIKTNLRIAAMLDIRCGNPATLPPTASAAFTAAPGCLPLPTANPYQISANAVFVVYSVGANGWGGTNINDITTSKPFTAAQIALTPDQAANAPERAGTTPATRRQFVTRARSSAVSNSGEYDDVLTYMSANTFAAKMLAAGVWP